MTTAERAEARKSFESWADTLVEMIGAGCLPGHPQRQQDLAAMLAGDQRAMAWGIFLAGFMSVLKDGKGA